MSKGPSLTALELEGLDLAPSQVWGAVRIIPLIRRDAPGDLRLSQQRYDESMMAVAITGDPNRPDSTQPWYFSYVPHALIVQWSTDGVPAAAFGSHLFRRDGRRVGSGPFSARVTARMVRRQDRDRLRLLPMHLAMEGFLALHFGGPDVAWSEYSRHAISWGLSPRAEQSIPGEAIRGLDDALRVFEIHDHQVGALVFVADALASAFVVSHPDDYRALHRSLIQDFYGELIWQYAFSHAGVGELGPALDDGQVRSVADLRAALGRMRAGWAEVQRYMADEVFARPLTSERCYELGPFTLQRFMTDLTPGNHNHIGECILRRDGGIEYLKTFRLSAAQSRRAYLLQQLARHRWNIEETAAALNATKDGLLLRLEKAGFGYLLREDVLAWARKRAKRRLT